MKRGQERHICAGPSSATHCDVGQLLPSLRDSGTCLDEDGLEVSREMCSGLLDGKFNRNPAFPILSPVVVSVSPRIRHRSRLPRVGGKEGEARLCHRESEVTSLWHPRGCTHTPASLFLAEKPLTSPTPFLYRAMEETSLPLTGHGASGKRGWRGHPGCAASATGTQDTPPVSL